MNIPLLDLGAQYQQLRGGIDQALLRVHERGQFVGGSESEALERELAEYLGVPEVVGVNSGTDALVLSLRALDIGVGDDVIVPTFTFFATAEAVSMVGARPVFADCAPGQYNLDAASLERALTPRTKAVIVVHLFGEPVDMEPVLTFCAAHGLSLVEDAAQAIGARYRGQRVGSSEPLEPSVFTQPRIWALTATVARLPAAIRHWPSACVGFAITSRS